MLYRHVRQQRRRRHPTDRCTPLHRWAVSVLHALNDNRAWKRHPRPFQKHQAGRARRATRRFVRQMDKVNLC